MTAILPKGFLSSSDLGGAYVNRKNSASMEQQDWDETRSTYRLEEHNERNLEKDVCKIEHELDKAPGTEERENVEVAQGGEGLVHVCVCGGKHGGSWVGRHDDDRRRHLNFSR